MGGRQAASDVDQCAEKAMNHDDVIKYLSECRCYVHIRQKTNIHTVNIGITHKCNLKCVTCNRHVESAPSDDMISIGQIRKFVQESIDCNWPWHEIVVYGGEPTIHPDYFEILDEIKRLKYALNIPRCKVVTNGIGKKVNDALDATPECFEIHRSTELKRTAMNINGKSVIPEFSNILQAPCDRIRGLIFDCQMHATCGLELTPYGFLPCSCGGARVVGLNVFFKQLSDVTIDECKKRLKTICAICGDNINYEIKCKHGTEPSKFWKRALSEYADSKPKLKRY